MEKILIRKRGTEEYIETIIDKEDVGILKKWTWSAKARSIKSAKRSKKEKFYVLRGTKINGKYKTIYLHKILCPSESPLTTDHINGNSMDNRRCNLRVATRSQQNANAIPSIQNKTSKFRGVTHKKYKDGSSFWVAKTKFLNESIYLGTFHTELEAAKAYDAYAIVTWGEFATLNFPEDHSHIA